MDKTTKTIVLVLLGLIVITSIIMMTKFRSLRRLGMTAEDEKTENHIRRQMKLYTSVMIIIFIMLAVITVYTFIRFFN